MTGSVFISYRRDDSGLSARGIYDRLQQRLGSNGVFIDVVGIVRGSDWLERLTTIISSCEILIAVIGKSWVTSPDNDGKRRIDDENDYVRIEIETALARNIPVIPVLVEKATMPRPEELPGALRRLPFRQGTTITVERFDSDVGMLAQEVDGILKKRLEDVKWAVLAETESKQLAPGEDSIAKLLDVLSVEFVDRELHNNVLFTLGQEMYDLCTADTLDDQCDIRLLITNLVNKGSLFHFLGALRTARPDSAELDRALTGFGSLTRSPTDADAVNAVRKGLQVLSELRADPSAPLTASVRIEDSQQKLTYLAEDLETLRAYKVLHDTLQKIQIDHYGQVQQKVGKLRQDVTIGDEIGAHIDSMRMLIQDAMMGAAVLKMMPSRFNPERRWIQTIGTAVDDLESSIQNNNDMAARGAVLTIRSVIRTNPVRVNQELREAAETLPLRDLISIFKQVASVLELTIRQKYLLGKAKMTLELLNINLQSRVALHNQWQELETELWGADDEFDKPSAEVADDVKLYWDKIQKKIKPLWALDPKQPWVKNTKQYAQALGSLQDVSGDEVMKARYNYSRFRYHARSHFYYVDASLREFCSTILKISQPLNEMISGADDDNDPRA